MRVVCGQPSPHVLITLLCKQALLGMVLLEYCTNDVACIPFAERDWLPAGRQVSPEAIPQKALTGSCACRGAGRLHQCWQVDTAQPAHRCWRAVRGPAVRHPGPHHPPHHPPFRHAGVSWQLLYSPNETQASAFVDVSCAIRATCKGHMYWSTMSIAQISTGCLAA